MWWIKFFVGSTDALNATYWKVSITFLVIFWVIRVKIWQTDQRGMNIIKIILRVRKVEEEGKNPAY